MLATTEHLMACGFNVRYGWTASDEISLLFDLGEDSYGRLERKILSVLAGEASALFSARLGAPACFDCRLSQLPSVALVVDYFRWRSEDAHRNAVNTHCYWLLRGQGATPQAVTERLSGMSIAAKNELLFQHGTNVNDLPGWQKRGTGLFWAEIPKAGTNPLTGETVTTLRRQIQRERDLPLKDAYDAFLMRVLALPSAT
jgi:tRNA(His) 5'-end guanylyltransferase